MLDVMLKFRLRRHEALQALRLANTLQQMPSSWNNSRKIDALIASMPTPIPTAAGVSGTTSTNVNSVSLSANGVNGVNGVRFSKSAIIPKRAGGFVGGSDGDGDGDGVGKGVGVGSKRSQRSVKHGGTGDGATHHHESPHGITAATAAAAAAAGAMMRRRSRNIKKRKKMISAAHAAAAAAAMPFDSKFAPSS